MAMEIGKTLRDARIRRHVDFAEVEAETKIRVRYLRALENEEWDILPGGAYTRSFIRTYATHLGLDGERLADEFRRSVEDPVGERYPRVEPPPARRAPAPVVAAGSSAPRLEISRGALAALISVGLIVLLIGIGLAGGDGDGGEETAIPLPGTEQRRDQARQRDRQAENPNSVSLRLTALADVWVCLLDSEDTPLVDGQILGAGAEQGPFRSRSFTVAFGNGEVELEIDGDGVEVEDTPNPVGYEIRPGEPLRPLEEAERPLCL
jgi:hypothetical protein